MPNVSFGNAPSTFSMRQIYDQNFDVLEEILNSKVLFADPASGANPVATVDIDMGGNDIINVGVISVDGIEIDGIDLNSIAADAAASAELSEGFKDLSQMFSVQGLEHRVYIDGRIEEFNLLYLGPLDEEPATEDATLGTIYLNTTDSNMYVCYAQSVLGGIVQENFWRPVAIDETNLGTSAYFDVTATSADFSNPQVIGVDWRPEDDDVYAACMTPDGASLVVAVEDQLRQYWLNVPYDIGTASGSFAALITNISKVDNIIWVNNGSSVHLLSDDDEIIKEYDCSTPYRIQGAAFSATRTWPVVKQDTFHITRRSMVNYLPGGGYVTYMFKNPGNDNWTVYTNELLTNYRLDTIGSTDDLTPVTSDTAAEAWVAFNDSGTVMATIMGKEVFDNDMMFVATVYSLEQPYRVNGSQMERIGKYTFSLTHDADIRMVQLLDNSTKLCVVAGSEVNWTARVYMYSLTNLSNPS